MAPTDEIWNQWVVYSELCVCFENLKKKENTIRVHRCDAGQKPFNG